MQINKGLLLLLFMICGLFTAQAQDGVTIETIDGVEYYQHSIEKGETLYSLAKKYNVDEELILRYNPHVKNGLKVGQKILIPVEKEAIEDQWSNPIRTQDGFYIHKVKKKETLFGIAKTYKTNIADILTNNEEVKSGLAIGMELKIPINDIDEVTLPDDKSQINLPDSGKYIYHFVQPGETLYSLSIAYSVTTKQIQDLNNGLPEGLKAGEKVKIKLKKEQPQTQIDPLESTQGENKTSQFGDKEAGIMTVTHRDWENINPEDIYQKDSIIHLDEYGIAFILPFYSNKFDRKDMKRNEALLQKISMNFYNGAMLALDTLKDYGLHAKIFAYELGRKDTALGRLFNTPDMSNTQLILGPLNRKQIFLAANESLKKKIHLVCPIPQSNKILLNHPNVSKVHPSAYSQISKLAEYVIANHHQDNIIVVNSLNLKDANLVNSFKKSYHEIIKNYPSAYTKIPKEHKIVLKKMDEIVNLLQSEVNNVIVVPSKDKVAIQGLFTELSMLSSVTYPITVYGLEDWIDYDFLDIDNLNKFHTSITSPSYIDYTDSQVKKFIKNYNRKFGVEPDSYAFLGYDIMMFYGKGLVQYGVNFPAYFDKIDKTGLIYTSMDFEQSNPKNGYENQHVFLLKFDNYTIKKESF